MCGDCDNRYSDEDDDYPDSWYQYWNGKEKK